jgi:TonB family protein
MRASVIGSTLVHLALIALAVWWHGPVTHIVVPGPEAVQVALIDPSALDVASSPAPPAPTPAPKPVATPPPKKNTPDREAVRLEKPTPKPKQKPPVEPPPVETEAPPPVQAPVTPAPATPHVSLSFAPLAAPGARGQVAVDNANFEFAYYLMAIRSRIGQAWAPPAGLPASGHPIQAVVYFRIGRDGHVDGARLESGSGFEFFDRSAMRAVLLSDPMPPLPLGYDGADLGVHFGFQYEVP